MTERRYGFRFSAVEAGLLVVSTVLASVFVFVAGVYVGKGVEAHKTAQLTPTVRMPLQIPDELRTAATNTPLTWKPPKDKPVGEAPSIATGTTEDPVQTPSPSTQSPLAFTQENAAKKTPATDGPPGKSQALPLEKSQPKTGELSHPPSTKKSSFVEESTSSARTAAVQSLTTENPAETRDTSSPTQKAARRTKGWKVQVEATSREETAHEIAKALRAQGYDSSVSKVTKQGEVLYRVRVGRFTTQEEAVAAIARFRREGKFSQAYPVSEE